VNSVISEPITAAARPAVDTHAHPKPNCSLISCRGRARVQSEAHRQFLHHVEHRNEQQQQRQQPIAPLGARLGPRHHIAGVGVASITSRRAQTAIHARGARVFGCGGRRRPFCCSPWLEATKFRIGGRRAVTGSKGRERRMKDFLRGGRSAFGGTFGRCGVDAFLPAAAARATAIGEFPAQLRQRCPLGAGRRQALALKSGTLLIAVGPRAL